MPQRVTKCKRCHSTEIIEVGFDYCDLCKPLVLLAKRVSKEFREQILSTDIDKEKLILLNEREKQTLESQAGKESGAEKREQLKELAQEREERIALLKHLGKI
jgi:hypothetical protein